MTILQWICRGYRSKYRDVRCLIFNQTPTIMCLQESTLGANILRLTRGYTIDCYSPTRNQIAGDGLVTFIREDVLAMKQTPNTVVVVSTTPLVSLGQAPLPLPSLFLS